MSSCVLYEANELLKDFVKTEIFENYMFILFIMFVCVW